MGYSDSRTMQPPWGQVVRNAFYTRVDGAENEWKCKCGTVRKQNGAGYSNLTSHVREKQPNDYRLLTTHSDSSSRNANSTSTPPSIFSQRKQCKSTAGLTLSYRDYYHFPLSRIISIESIFAMNLLRKVPFANTWKSWQFMSREKYKSSYHLVSLWFLMDGLLETRIMSHASHRILLIFLMDLI